MRRKKGQATDETQAEPAPEDSGHQDLGTPNGGAPEQQEGEGQPCIDTHSRFALPDLITELRELQAHRVMTVRAQNRLDNQCRAMARRYCGWKWDMDEKQRNAANRVAAKLVKAVQKDKEPPEGLETAADALRPFCMASLSARAYFDKYRNAMEKRMAEIARQFPVCGWWNAIPGCGALGLALIVAECGDLSNYDGTAKVWKRLGVAVIDGKGQRRVKDAEEALRHGFNPRRRSVLWNIGDALIKQNQTADKKPLYYYALYLERKAYELARNAETLAAMPEKDRPKPMTKMHAPCPKVPI